MSDWLQRHHRVVYRSVQLAALLLAVAPEARAQEPVAPSSTQPASTTTAPSTPQPAGESPLAGGEYQTYEWVAGHDPIRLISKDEGFCFLTEVGGHFAGDGEAVRVYIGDDGFWYLGGQAQQPLHAKAMSVKFARKLAMTVVKPEDPKAKAWRDIAASLMNSNDPALKALAAREQPAPPTQSDSLMALADDWQKSIAALPVEQLRLAEQHVLALYSAAVDQLSDAPKEAARKREQDVHMAQMARQLNDLGMWKVNTGKWFTTTDGKFEGHGESEMVFAGELPGNCKIEFKTNVVEGIRPRIRLMPGDLLIGTETFVHQFEVYGAETQRGVPFHYSLGQTCKLTIKLVDKQFEFYVDDQLMARGTRKNVPATFSLSLSAGDGWSAGVVQFWDLKVTPAN